MDESRLRKAVVLIAKQRPRGYLQVLGRLTQLAKLEVERHTHEVISSVQLEDGGKAVFALLEKHFGKPLAQRTEVRSELLGGLKIRVGSDVWDATIRGRLEALTRAA